MNLPLRIALAGVALVLSGQLAVAQSTRFDSLTDFEAGSNGAALTPALLAAGTHGAGGTWSVTQDFPPRLFLTNAFASPLLCGVQVGSTVFGDSAGTRTYACNVPLAQQYISYHFTVRPARISIGFFFRLSAFPNKGDSYDFVVFEGGGEFQSFNYDDSNSGGVLRNHTQSGAIPTSDCTSNTTYWATMLWDKNAGEAGRSTLMVYDAGTWQLLGSNTMDHSSRQNVEDLHLGRFDNHGTEEDADSWAYYDDLIINLTGSVYPILPKCVQDPALGISPVTSLSVALNEPAGPIAFAVSNGEVPASNLVVAVSSSDPVLFPAGSLVLSGGDSSRSLKATPATGRSGTATMTLSVSDGIRSSSTAFDLTVRSIAAPGSYLLAEGFDAPGFDNAGWTVSGAADPDYTGFVLDGVQSLRCVGAQTVSRDFSMPQSFHLYGQVRWKTWSDFQNLICWEDADFSLAAAVYAERGHLRVLHGFASSVGGTLIVPEVTYHLWVDWTAGTAGAGILRLFLSTSSRKPATPEAVVTAGDGAAVARMQLGATADGPDVLFDRLLVSEAELGSNPGGSQAPTLSAIPDQVIPQDAVAGPLSFVVRDLETPPDQLTVTASSSNPSLLPETGTLLGGTGANRTVTLRPAAGRVGSATVMLQVSDGTQSANLQFGVTVMATNGAGAGVYRDSFAPVVDGTVNVLLVQPNGAVLLGGLFQSVDGSPRSLLARVRADGLLDPDFNPGAAKPAAPELAAVHALAWQADGRILVGGEFTILAGAPRDGLGRLNTDGTVDAGFNPAPGGRVQAIVIQPNGRIVVGGDFSLLAGQPRRSLGRLKPDGTLDAGFAPELEGDVTSLILNPDGTLVVAGTIQAADGVSVSNVVRLLSNGRFDPSFVAGTDGRVEALAGQRDGRILVGGRFALLNGEERSRLGRLLPSGGLDTNFIANGSGPVESLCLLADGRIVVGGQFNLLGRVECGSLARLRPGGSVEETFGPGADGAIHAIVARADGKLLVGGEFTALSGSARGHVGRLNRDGSLDAPLDPAVDGVVATVAVQPDGRLLVAGAFSVVQDSPRQQVARLAADGTPDPGFDPGPNGTVDAVAVQADRSVLLAGAFTRFTDGKARYVGRVDAHGVPDTDFIARPNAPCRSLLLQPDGRVVLTGDFTVVDGRVRRFLARLQRDGSLDQTFNPEVNGAVESVALQSDGKLIVAGRFSTLNGQTRGLLGRLNGDGTLDPAFNPGVGGTDGTFGVPYLSTVCVQPDGRILIGGLFTSVNGQPRSFLARLEPDGRLDGTFTPGLSLQSSFLATSIVLQADGRIVIAGTATGVASPATTLLRLNADGTLDTTADGGGQGGVGQSPLGVWSAALQADGGLLAAGNFSTFSALARTNLARRVDAETASQSLEVNAVGTVVSWMRSGAAPELEQVTFEQSLDGTNYTLLGRGERMAGGWQLSGLTLPQTSVFLVRAGGRAVCGRNNGSSGRIGQTVEFYLFSPLRLVPSAGLRGDGSFEFQFTRLSGGAFTVLATTNVAAARPVWESLGPPNSLGNGVYQFSDRPVPGRPQRFYQIRSD